MYNNNGLNLELKNQLLFLLVASRLQNKYYSLQFLSGDIKHLLFHVFYSLAVILRTMVCPYIAYIF